MDQAMNQTGEQSLVEHLIDLKKCIIRTLLIIFVGFCISIYFSDKIFDLIRAPIVPYLGDSGGLVFTAPIDKFMAHLKVSFLAGTIVTSPFWLYQLWLFIAPGLYKNEKKAGVTFIFFGTILFLLGVLFVYKIVYPMAFKYLLTFGGQIDKPMITISEYLGFFITTTLMFGAAFEMPLILVVLAMLGLIDDQFLRTKRRMAIMIMAVLAAVITPPDAISMLSMLGPLIFLYEVSIWVVRWLGRKQASTS
ncbi:MAG: twin arginine-targeting protein translocase TatC [Bdellovibrionales bacterium RBG_16_40_8]|nr:MAG: twin arginine-targeting protein translocase TatC [Bdellovibrionales bacterium RBG_16_40_8]